jgi:hypothetical protein
LTFDVETVGDRGHQPQFPQFEHRKAATALKLGAWNRSRHGDRDHN